MSSQFSTINSASLGSYEVLVRAAQKANALTPDELTRTLAGRHRNLEREATDERRSPDERSVARAAMRVVAAMQGENGLDLESYLLHYLGRKAKHGR
jgi:hypothetical protein